ncbi:MAG: hypothetical protein EON59_03495 [Alphaproteobacteria bacterium]|nr:MAG: hypothetical protein EON59_03495 [Alphaproteobacteria bacterium]
MHLQIATVIPGSESPAGDGLSGAMRCVIVLPDGSRRAAIIKRGPVGEIAAEAFGALVLTAWGLPVPEPFLVDEGGGPAFATADVGYPNLKKRLSLDALPDGPAKVAAQAIAVQLAVQLPSTPLAVVADEAIDNRDRNLGNILWDGQDEAWIDHALALGEHPHGYPDRNKLCDMAQMAGEHERVSRAAVGQALAISSNPLATASAALPATLQGRDHAAYVAARLNNLAARVLDRFPKPADLFNDANQQA